MTIPYTCKFCRRPGTTELEGQHTDMYRINKWHELLCCDRCGDFHSERIALRDRMTSIVGFIQQRKMADKFTPELESKVREKLVEITKKFAILVCNFHNPEPFLPMSNYPSLP